MHGTSDPFTDIKIKEILVHEAVLRVFLVRGSVKRRNPSNFFIFSPQQRFSVSRTAAVCSIRDCFGLTEENAHTFLVEEYAEERMKKDLEWSQD